ncbi:F-box only protein 24 isoform X1 [Astyanax mexicanus]|uniref:F-box only protein 24 isoform X1 n=1 Tax=Astyanax mexicanus TaxID=7994 RepID=UPI0020CB3C0E|nr:F-box only protein 24 isoform X1 [Astyanax mexicanus]
MRGRKRKFVKHRCNERSTAPPNVVSDPKRKRSVSPSKQREKTALTILSLLPEMLEKILFNLSATDVVSFGATCRYFHELSLSQAVWKRLYWRQFIGPALNNKDVNWRRFTILKMSQGLAMQRLNKGVRRIGLHQQHARARRPTGVHLFNSSLALGFRRVEAILEQTLLWDYNGTIFALITPIGRAPWSRPYSYSVLCYRAIDFAVDPRWNHNLRHYIYVLTLGESSGKLPESVGNPGSVGDTVEVFEWDTHERVCYISFHSTIFFTQLRLSGSENRRLILLLTDDGIVYSAHLNETMYSRRTSYTTELTPKTVSCQLPNLPVKQLHTSSNSTVYIKADGSAFAEVHSPGALRQLFGTYEGFNPIGAEMVYPLRLPSRVVKCSLGPNHLCLLDNCGRIFMQGCNHHGQLGTGDKIDRAEPTLVIIPMAPVNVWCGLNHTLVLLEAECGDKQVQGCGCGSRGRLPGHLGGSSVFVRLKVQVPRHASSLYSSSDFLYIICCHDITEPPARFYIPPEVTALKDAEKKQKEEIEKLHMDLTQMKRCVSTKRGIKMLQRAVNEHMTGLSPAHKDFLDSALSIILHGESRSTEEPEQQPHA